MKKTVFDLQHLSTALTEFIHSTNPWWERKPGRVLPPYPGLRASWLQETVPLDPEGLWQSPHLGTLAGHIAESATGYFLANNAPLGILVTLDDGAEIRDLRIVALPLFSLTGPILHLREAEALKLLREQAKSSSLSPWAIRSAAGELALHPLSPHPALSPTGGEDK